MRPNGLAYDAKRRLVLAANVGDPAVPHSYTLSMVDLDARTLRASIEVPGRTRWTVFDADAKAAFDALQTVFDSGNPQVQLPVANALADFLNVFSEQQLDPQDTATLEQRDFDLVL